VNFNTFETLGLIIINIYSVFTKIHGNMINITMYFGEYAWIDTDWLRHAHWGVWLESPEIQKWRKVSHLSQSSTSGVLATCFGLDAVSRLRLYGIEPSTIGHTTVSLQTMWRTNNKGDVGIYILYERPPVQELYITRLAYLSTSPEQCIMSYKLLYHISYLF